MKMRHILVALLAATGGTAVHAQAADTGAPAAETDPGESGDGGIEDIIVSARRRAERNQTVPISISAFNGAQLEKRGATQLMDLANVAPGVKIEPQNNRPSTPQVAIRAQRQYGAITAQDPPTAFYFADAAVSPIYGLSAGFHDLASVQVLKGPQGTLFGRNTDGGAVVIAPNKPTDKFEGLVKGTVGNYATLGLQGFLNLPVSETLLLRAAGYYNRHGAYQNSIDPRTAAFKPFNDRTFDGRLSAIWRPTDNLEEYLVTYYTRNRNTTILPVIAAINPLSSVVRYNGTGIYAAYPNIFDQLWTPGSRDPLDIYVNTGLPFEHVQVYGGVNTISLTLGEITLKDIASYRHVKSLARIPTSGTSAPVIDSKSGLTSDTFSNELQLLGNSSNNRLDWVAGLYFDQLKALNTSHTTVLYGPPQTATVTPFVADTKNRSYAAYAQFTYKVIDDLALTAGVRYSVDDRNIDLHHLSIDAYPEYGIPYSAFCNMFDDAGVRLPVDRCSIKLSKKFKKPTWTLTANYTFAHNSMIYITNRKGYRSGGFNQRAINAAQRVPFDAETVLDYEAGIKSDFRIGTWNFRLNADYYHDKYSNLQRVVPSLIPGIGVVNSFFNAASGVVEGVEAEFTVMPTAALTLNAAYAYTKPRYNSFDYVEGGVTRDFSDRDFAGVPRHSLTAYANYDLPLDSALGKASVTVNYTYQGSSFISEAFQSKEDFAVRYTPAQLALIPDNTRFKSPHYGLFNARLDWSNVAGKPFDVSLYMRNVFDKRAAIFSNPSYEAQGIAALGFGPPRTFGLEISYRFGG